MEPIARINDPTASVLVQWQATTLDSYPGISIPRDTLNSCSPTLQGIRYSKRLSGSESGITRPPCSRAIYDHEGEWWLRDTYIGLVLRNCRVYRLFTHALNLQELTIDALAARNALEMKVWISYVSGGEKNARRLYDDQIVNARDLMARINGLLALVPDDQRPSELAFALENSQKIIDENVRSSVSAMTTGISGRSVLLRKSAVGMSTRGMFPIMSKAMHPTGLSMFLNHSGETGEHQIIQLCSVGIQYFANLQTTSMR